MAPAYLLVAFIWSTSAQPLFTAKMLGGGVMQYRLMGIFFDPLDGSVSSEWILRAQVCKAIIKICM